MNNNELPEERKEGFFRNTSKSLKAIAIGFLTILLLIPMWMIEDIIRERQVTQREATEEVSQKWSTSQTLTGPYLSIPATIQDENAKAILTNIILLPDELTVDGQLITETRRRGIYEINVYQSELTLSGCFSVNELKKLGIEENNFHFDQATLCLGITDLRGIGEQISIQWGENTYYFESGIGSRGFNETGVSTLLDATPVKEKIIPYEMKIKLKGSQSLFFIPVGKTTKVNLRANWHTPSFGGNYLPEKHTVSDTGFTAQWQVLHLNRSYPQAFTNQIFYDKINESSFGVNLKVPVEEYQQSMRTAKYAILIIALTFIVIFFVEIRDKKPFHAFQYLLVGLALCLFYTLLLSISEHINFGIAYLIAALLTISLISLYINGIMKEKRPALLIGGLLVLLYTYIYILIQLETLALLAGSLGLFVILALVMYLSKKINWFSE